MLHLYAVIDRPEVAAPEIAGVDGRHPVFVARDSVALAVGRGDAGQAATLTAIERHEAVVEALMADHAVLPARFGSLLPDEAAAEGLLSERYGEIVAGLERVRGCVEVGLHMAWRSIVATHRPGERAGQAAHAAFEAHIGRTQAQLARYARRARRMAIGVDDHVADLAFLVATDWLPTLLAKARAVRQEYREAVMVCTGPWPPYSFVDLDLSGRAAFQGRRAGDDR